MMAPAARGPAFQTSLKSGFARLTTASWPAAVPRAASSGARGRATAVNPAGKPVTRTEAKAAVAVLLDADAVAAPPSPKADAGSVTVPVVPESGTE